MPGVSIARGTHGRLIAHEKLIEQALVESYCTQLSIIAPPPPPPPPRRGAPGVGGGFRRW